MDDTIKDKKKYKKFLHVNDDTLPVNSFGAIYLHKKDHYDDMINNRYKSKLILLCNKILVDRIWINIRELFKKNEIKDVIYIKYDKNYYMVNDLYDMYDHIKIYFSIYDIYDINNLKYLYGIYSIQLYRRSTADIRNYIKYTDRDIDSDSDSDSYIYNRNVRSRLKKYRKTKRISGGIGCEKYVTLTPSRNYAKTPYIIKGSNKYDILYKKIRNNNLIHINSITAT